MTWQGFVTLALTVGMVAAMVRNHAPDLVLVAGMTVLLTLKIISPEEAVAGFGNEGMLSVAVLFVVAAGVRETGGLDWVVRNVLGRPRGAAEAQLRMMTPVATLSAFINNTPLMAIMIPIVQDWARRLRMSPSKLLMPLSWATILGGTCTLIGTSTNLVVFGLAREHLPDVDIGLFDIAWLGVPVLLIGLVYVPLFSRWLLPDRGAGIEERENPREYTVTMRIEPNSPIVGETIEDAGLRHLPGLFLVEIERDGELMPAVGPDARLRANDQLLFAGVVESVVDLRKIRGLVPATDQLDKLTDPRPDRRLAEAVIASGSSLAGKTVREARFRTVYGAAIIAVHRNGERIAAKVGDIELQTGDVLLLETSPAFLRAHGKDRDFALVSEVAGSTPPRHDRAWIAAGLMLGMIVVNAMGWMSLLNAALLAAGAMIATGCLSGTEAVRSVEVRVLIAIAAAFATGAALQETGVAGLFGETLVRWARPLGSLGILAGVYVAAAVLTELITNNAAAAIMFPFAVATAQTAGLPVKPFLLVLMMAASASFATPIGYTTNLMAYGAGGYRFGDFLRFGAPFQVLLAAITILVAWSLWF
jgi:di/tricarboxylate transporter